MRFLRKKRKYHLSEIAPDEIFLDSKNIPEFDTQQFEGRIEKPIKGTNLLSLGVVFVIIGILFLGRLGNLQIRKGEAYAERSASNSLNKRPIFANRGVIYDRNNVEIVWNEKAENGDYFPHRAYYKNSGFAHIVGYLNYPKKDKNGYYYQTEAIGKDGVEKIFDEKLAGTNGIKIEETDASGNAISENAINPPKDGENLILSIDAKIQEGLYNSIASLSDGSGFRGGAGVIMDINNGEILALTSYPEYNPAILAEGDDSETISSYMKDSRKVFLNRAVSGLYTPGSIVKPFIGLGALNEGVITPEKNILSNGSISIPNPYFPDQKSVFKDHGVFGYVDMRKAIAISSDVYFYEIGGGFQDQPGLGIARIDSYVKKFGISMPTGINLPGEVEGTIPTPEWKAKVFKGDIWRVGDTYNTSIGQYGFQVTPIQMVRAIAAIANGGTLVTPTILKDDPQEESEKTFVEGINEEYYKVVRDGMRQVVTEGTAQTLSVPFTQVSAKTGTAQVGISKQNINSWVVGFFPKDDPKYAFAVLMDYAPKTTTYSAAQAMRKTLDYMRENSPEYFGLPPKTVEEEALPEEEL